MSDELFAALRQAVIDGDAGAAGTLAQQALDTGVPPLAAIDNGLVPGLSFVGEEFGKGELFLPDMMLAARAMQKAMAILEPELQAQAAKRHVVGRVVIGTVKGEHNADIIGVSALLTTTMAGQRTVVEALAAAGLRESVKVIVGGAPASESWAAEIGADGYSEDAIGAVALARKLLGAEVAATA